MFCKNCGAPIGEGAVVCLKCGVPVGAGTKFCGNCGAQPDPLAVICVRCGCSLNGKAPKPVVNNSTSAGGVMSFGEAIKAGFSKYATFSGRASRSEFWWWYLFSCLVSMTYIGVFVVMIPSIAMTVRRLHDIGKSGWFYFIGCIPIVGLVFMIIWLTRPSDPHTNEYGPRP